MAAVQSVHAMTLGQNSKMFNNNYQVIPGQNNCVIVSTGIPSQTAIHQGKRLLAPTSADHRTTVLVNTISGVPSDSRCKKKLQYQHHLPYGSAGHQPASVARRNARERNRVKQVNNGFATLRQHIPSNVAAALSTTNGRGASKKLSKVDTLRMAVEYIRSLKELLDENDTDTASTSTGHSSHESQSYYEDSPDQHMGHPRMMVQTPPSSEASASPTPSYSSDGSMSVAPTTYLPASSYPKTEHYDSYEPMSPEDEELLDVISWWQQQ